MSKIEVTQADRDACAELQRYLLESKDAPQAQIDCAMRNIIGGHADLGPMTQTFARHRIAHQPQPSQADVERVARSLAPHLEGGREYGQMPQDRRALRDWARQAMCSTNDATQDDAKEAAQSAIAAMPSIEALRAEVNLWKREAADRSEGMVQLNLDRAAMGVELMQAKEERDEARAEVDRLNAGWAKANADNLALGLQLTTTQARLEEAVGLVKRLAIYAPDNSDPEEDAASFIAHHGDGV